MNGQDDMWGQFSPAKATLKELLRAGKKLNDLFNGF
jgi:hypothetical protein